MLTPYLLAGGQSTRMGQDKAFLQLNNQTLLEAALHRLRTFGTPFILSGNPSNLDRSVRLAQYAPIVPDRTPLCGPLGGIDAALHHSPTAWTLILPIDQPFLPVEAITNLVRQTLHSTAKAAWFTHPHGIEPLPLLLHRSLAEPLAHALAAGHRKILPTLRTLAGKHLYEAFHTEAAWFTNLNHPADLEAVEIASRKILSSPPPA